MGYNPYICILCGDIEDNGWGNIIEPEKSVKPRVEMPETYYDYPLTTDICWGCINKDAYICVCCGDASNSLNNTHLPERLINEKYEKCLLKYLPTSPTGVVYHVCEGCETDYYKKEEIKNDDIQEFYSKNIVISGRRACGKSMFYSNIYKTLIDKVKDIIVFTQLDWEEDCYKKVGVKPIKYDESIIKAVYNLQKYKLGSMDATDPKNWIILAFDDIFYTKEEFDKIRVYLETLKEYCISFHFITNALENEKEGIDIFLKYKGNYEFTRENVSC